MQKRAYLTLIIPLLSACGPAVDLSGCYESCTNAGCSQGQAVFLDVTNTGVDEVAPDGSGCRYDILADGPNYILTPLGCTAASAGLPDQITWKNIDYDEEEQTLSFTEVHEYPAESGLSDVQGSPNYRFVSCSNVPALNL